MDATRCTAFFLVAAMFAGATTASIVACKSGEYDGSYDGSFDSGGGAGGGVTSRVVQPDKPETVTSTDGAFDVTFVPGTFAAPTMITITFAGERTLDTGLLVPIYAVTADKPPGKVIQVTFRGNANSNGELLSIIPAIEADAMFKALPIVSSSNSFGGSTSTYWGLSKTLGTFSLLGSRDQGGALAQTFADTLTSCTGKCCAQKGMAVTGYPGGCACATGPDLACFVEQCPDIEAAALRCTAIAAGASFGNVPCKPFAVGSNCPGPACNGYPGICGTGGGSGPGGGNSKQTCCVANSMGTCASSPQPCTGFAARCTATAGCAPDMTCCVFENESYCAKSCPPGAQRACATNADCNEGGVDAGAEAGTCQGAGCPVGVCGQPPAACR